MALFKPPPDQQRNHLFRAMRALIGSRAMIDALTISLDQGAVVCEPGDDMTHVYFPLSCVLSAVSVHNDGTLLATTLRGHEGAFGLLTALRRAKTHARCQVQIAGHALKVEGHQLLRIFESSRAVRQLFLSYWDAVMVQYEQTAICNRVHPVASRLSRCLLEIDDRIVGDVFSFTHQHLANLIAANRTTVSLATSGLRRNWRYRYHSWVAKDH